MSELPQDPGLYDIPEAQSEPKKRFSLQIVWLIPLVAAIIGGTLAVKTYLNKGPTITITFKTGEGLEAGKTKIKYKDVEVGLVKELIISKDTTHVIATAELKKGVAPYLVEDTSFWVVRPQISGGSVTGLGTLMGGSYIGMDLGKSKQEKRDFKGLETAPVISMDVPGSRFQLHSPDLGSLDIGSPIYYRRIQVGQVLSYNLDGDGKGVTFKVFVNAPYDKYVKANSRFWHASGIDLAVDANGLKLNTQSLVSILLGGIAFQTLDEHGPPAPIDPNEAFTLFANRDDAMKHRDNISTAYTMVFVESVRGLTVGAPVDFRGVVIGEVTAINVEFDKSNREINMLVEVRIYPERLRSRAVNAKERDPRNARYYMDQMVEGGLRAQLRSGNMLTGQLYVSLEFFPSAPKARIDWGKNPPTMPTTPSSLVELQATLTRIMGKLEKLPVDELVGEVRQALQSLDATIKSADQLIKRIDTQVVPEAQATLVEARKAMGAAKQTLSADAPLQQDLREALREMARAAQSLRVLTDYLDRHPESLIRGKQEDKP
jgi:paraquat-inducible protein B